MAQVNEIRADAMNYPLLDEPETPAAYDTLQREIQDYRELKGAARLRASYNALLYTNVNGFFVPLRFQCRLAPVPKVPFLLNGFDGVVTNVTDERQEEWLLPKLSGRVEVQDRRVRFKAGQKWRRDVFYPLDATGWIRDTNDPRIILALKTSPTYAPRIASPSRNAGLKVVAALFILVFVSPLVIILAVRRRRAIARNHI